MQYQWLEAEKRDWPLVFGWLQKASRNWLQRHGAVHSILADIETATAQRDE